MDSTEAQTQQEMARIVSVVEELTGLPSRWSGRVELVPNPTYKGAKSFSCLISLDVALADQDERWTTLIHEVLHSVSVGFGREDYEQGPGWEEGVVEQMQRLLRPQVLARLSVSIPQRVLNEADASHPYNSYLVALENIREALQTEKFPFYLRLLQTPIKGRIGIVLAGMHTMHGDDKNELVRVFAKANATLKKRLL